jgi:hypothetical protein
LKFTFYSTTSLHVLLDNRVGRSADFPVIVFLNFRLFTYGNLKKQSQGNQQSDQHDYPAEHEVTLLNRT